MRRSADGAKYPQLPMMPHQHQLSDLLHVRKVFERDYDINDAARGLLKKRDSLRTVQPKAPAYDDRKDVKHKSAKRDNLSSMIKRQSIFGPK